MNTSIIHIGTRAYQTTLPLNQELVFESNKNYLFNLNQLSAIKVSGEKAAEFLQGQLSCDIRLVNETQIQQGALCNLKGRVLALLDIVYCWNNYWLILPTDLVEATLQSLEKTALLSRVTLEALDQHTLQVNGLIIQSNQDILPHIDLPTALRQVTSTATTCCYQISTTNYIMLTLNDAAKGDVALFQTHHQLKYDLAWHFTQLQQQKFSIYPETRGLFLPHRLDLHNSGYISFDKGCYKGQEIIARMHYRATLKHEFVTSITHLDVTPVLGEQLLDTKTMVELGELIDYCPMPKNNEYLVAFSAQGSLINALQSR